MSNLSFTFGVINNAESMPLIVQLESNSSGCIAFGTESVFLDALVDPEAGFNLTISPCIGSPLGVLTLLLNSDHNWIQFWNDVPMPSIKVVSGNPPSFGGPLFGLILSESQEGVIIVGTLEI
jgi:hypothetical protein